VVIEINRVGSWPPKSGLAVLRINQLGLKPFSSLPTALIGLYLLLQER